MSDFIVVGNVRFYCCTTVQCMMIENEHGLALDVISDLKNNV